MTDYGPHPGGEYRLASPLAPEQIIPAQPMGWETPDPFLPETLPGSVPPAVGPPPPPVPAPPWAGPPPAGPPPAGPPPAGPPPAAPGPNKGRGLRRALTIAAVAALVGGVGGGVLAGTLGGGSSSTNAVQVSTSANLASDQGNSVAAITSAAEPAVVTIKSIVEASTETSTTYGSSTTSEFGRSGGEQEEELEGTGMIVTSSGEVVTNNHVIAGASSIAVTLHGSSKSYTAKVIGTDPTADVALLQIEGVSGLPTVTFGDSSSLQVGDSVVAIGNALGLSGGPTVTSGIISAENRTITASDDNGTGSETLTGMLQTDAAINPGNSGGPLIDSAGQVIGMDTAAAGSDSSGTSSQDIGFAIPSNRIVSLIAQLRQGGTTS